MAHDMLMDRGKSSAVKEKLRQQVLGFAKLKKQLNKKNDDLVQCNTQLENEIAKRKIIETEILEISQAEQRRFGSQLHDGLCQQLTAILMFAKTLSRKMEKEKKLELDELKRISDMLMNAVDQARDTARGLYPGELEGASLMHSLEELVTHAFGVSCVFDCPNEILINDNNIATHIYRIAQEAISNAVRHGKAQNVIVSFTEDKKNISLVIKDDGIGMKENFTRARGIGLKIMKYRAHLINATFHIKPNLPRGVLLEFIMKRPKI